MAKVYVLMKFQCDRNDDSTGLSSVLGVATTRDKAEDYVRNYKLSITYDRLEMDRDPDGDLYKSYYMKKNGHDLRFDIYYLERDLID